MNWPEIVAHRGAPGPASENTLPAFLRAVEMGADAVELDIRLTADHIPVVYHYYYLEELNPLASAIFNYRWTDLRRSYASIPSLEAVLSTLDGRTGLEIEIKGPEPQAADIVAYTLQACLTDLHKVEITSYEPLLLQRFRSMCPEVPTDLLIPLSEPWMKADVLAYSALQRAHLAGARAVHLHASQLDREIVASIRQGGVEVHAWGMNNPAALQAAFTLGLPRLCTDDLAQAIEYRKAHVNECLTR